MLDIDNFKKYNDHYGHQSGDDCLRSVAHAIEATVHQSNQIGNTQGAFAARYGGEEFAVIVPLASQPALTNLAHLLVKAVQGLNVAHELNETWAVVTMSVGGTLLVLAQGELHSVFRQADSRLYQAKKLGRNRAVMEG
jgi:diguanylate cyclase (GGDEF)-like protein